MPGDGAKKLVEKRYREELRRLQAYWPAEHLTLTQLAEGRRSIRLHNGETHVFSEEEVQLLLSRVPGYFHDHMTVPILLRYTRSPQGSRYIVLGGRWQRRLVEILLRGDYSFDGVGELKVSEFIELARKYRSLIFVGLTL